jgi:mannitol-specific phosphotransferase system IIBC component
MRNRGKYPLAAGRNSSDKRWHGEIQTGNGMQVINIIHYLISAYPGTLLVTIMQNTTKGGETMKKLLSIIFSLLFALSVAGVSYAAEEKKMEDPAVKEAPAKEKKVKKVKKAKKAKKAEEKKDDAAPAK